MENNKLPVPVHENFLKGAKSKVQKLGKIAGLSLATTGFATAFLLSIAFSFSTILAPIFVIPSAIGIIYSGEALFNNTKYKSDKDLAFITRKKGENIKIFQDDYRNDIYKNIKKFSATEKVGFLQLQSIMGLSKWKNQVEPSQKFETDTHSILQKTFKQLQTLGYIENYEETPLKRTIIREIGTILPKLSFGNIKAVKDFSQQYNVKFNLTDKKFSIEDKELQKAFPLVFNNRRGILANHNWDIERKEDESFSVNYKASKSFIPKKEKENALKKDVKKGTPSPIEQKAKVEKFLEQQKETIKEVEDRDK